MGMLSTYYRGKIRDWKFKVDMEGRRHCFYLDQYLIGQLFNDKRCGWTSVPSEPVGLDGPVRGFKRRYDAAQFALQVVEKREREKK